jgi:CBS domain-containing protein
MRKTQQSLLTLTAEDLMTSQVATIPQDMPLPTAAHVLSQADVTGAPVVNHEGRCVGVLSATDFLHWAEAAGQGDGRCQVPVCVCSDGQMIEREFIPREEVYRHMTRDPVLVKSETRITDLARRMLDAHIHSVVVVDAQRRPVGIVSATDVLAAVAYAEDWAEEFDEEIQCCE